MVVNYDLRRVKNREQLLTFLGLEEQFFRMVCDFDVDEHLAALNSDDWETYLASPFVQHRIPKRNRNRGERVVWEATSSFDRQFKATSRRLEAFFTSVEPRFPHENCFGYVRGRNIKENAEQHLGRRFLYKFDIKNFFGSIDVESVRKLFVKYEVERDVANLLAEYLTIGGTLPLGLSTSPIITNALCLPLDNALADLAAQRKCRVTRYADDITFSSDDKLPELEDVRQLLRRYGFELADEKTRKTTIGQAHYVTGLSVSDPRASHVPRQTKRKLRQQLYYATKYGLSDHLTRVGIDSAEEQKIEINSIDGLVRYVCYHEPNLAKSAYQSWASILEADGESPSFKPKNRSKSVVHIFADETEFDWNGKTYLALALCVTRKYEEIYSKSHKVLANYLADPLSDGDRKKISKNGLHFNDASEDLRKVFVREMQKLPFLGYVSVAALSENETYEQTYLKLLGALVRRRLIACDGLHALLKFEETSKVSKDNLQDLVDVEFNKLRENNNRRPFLYSVEQVSKKTVGVSLPDFLLGVLRRYILSTPNAKKGRLEREEMMFEYVRDKLVILADLDRGEEHSRRNPIVPWSE